MRVALVVLLSPPRPHCCQQWSRTSTNLHNFYIINLSNFPVNYAHKRAKTFIGPVGYRTEWRAPVRGFFFSAVPYSNPFNEICIDITEVTFWLIRASLLELVSGFVNESELLFTFTNPRTPTRIREPPENYSHVWVPFHDNFTTITLCTSLIGHRVSHNG